MKRLMTKALLVLVCLLSALQGQTNREGKYRGRTASQWLERLKSDDAKDRDTAFTALTTLGAPAKQAAVAVLVEMLDDQDKEFRAFAVSCLGDLGPAARESVPALVPLLKESDEEIREVVMSTLRKLGPKAQAAAVPVLTAMLKNADQRVCAIYHLGELGPLAKGDVPALIIPFLKDDDEFVRDGAAAALKMLGPKGHEPAMVVVLSSMLSDRDSKRQTFAVAQLAELGPTAKGCVPALIALLNDRLVRKEAISALAGLGKDAAQAVLALAALLSVEESLDVNLAAANALSSIGAESRAALPALRKLFDGTNPDTSSNSAYLKQQLMRAMSGCGPDGALVLMDIFENSRKEWVCASAVVALGKMGPEARAIVPRLIKALPATSWICRTEGAWALWQIEKHPFALESYARVLGEYTDEGPPGPSPAWHRDSNTWYTTTTDEHGDPTSSDCPLRDAEAICRELGQIGPPAKQVVPQLVCLLSNSSRDVRRNAAHALWLIAKHGSSVPALEKCLLRRRNSYDEPEVDMDAVRILGEIGPEAKSALSALRKISERGDQETIAQSMRRIRGDEPRKEPPPVARLKEPTLCPAVAVEANGTIQIHVMTAGERIAVCVPKQVYRTVIVQVRGGDGIVRAVQKRVPCQITVTEEQTVLRTSVLIVDGKTVKAAGKDGKPVDAKDLLKLLKEQTPVLVVPGDRVDPAQLRKTEDGTLVIFIKMDELP